MSKVNEDNPSLANVEGSPLPAQDDGLLPCPKCNDCWMLQQFETDINAIPSVLCGRCGFSAPYETWQARSTQRSDAVNGDDDYVAWCRYTYDGNGCIRTIVTCDSDAEGAFKVYRNPLTQDSISSSITSLAVRVVEKIYGLCEAGASVSIPTLAEIERIITNELSTLPESIDLLRFKLAADRWEQQEPPDYKSDAAEQGWNDAVTYCADELRTLISKRTLEGGK